MYSFYRNAVKICRKEKEEITHITLSLPLTEKFDYREREDYRNNGRLVTTTSPISVAVTWLLYYALLTSQQVEEADKENDNG